MKSVMFVSVAWLIVAAIGVSEESKPHEGFEGIRWGASVDEVQKVFPTARAKPLDAARALLGEVGG